MNNTMSIEIDELDRTRILVTIDPTRPPSWQLAVRNLRTREDDQPQATELADRLEGEFQNDADGNIGVLNHTPGDPETEATLFASALERMDFQDDAQVLLDRINTIDTEAGGDGE